VTDIFSKEKRSEIMSKIRGRDTEPEEKIKEFLDRADIDYEHQAEVGGWTVDFLLDGNLIVEYRSCFWHLCEEHGSIPKSNRGYWEPKLKGNRKRDRKKDDELREAGYEVEVIWSHDDLAERLGEITETFREGSE